MYCQKCGNKLIEGAEVCPNCGARVLGPEGKPVSSGSKTALIVVGVAVGCFGLVIVMGILAAIAIPKFAATKEKAYEAAMKADLRNLAVAQQTYFTENKAYASTVAALQSRYRPMAGVTVQIDSVMTTGWRGTATHVGTAKTCVITIGGSSTEAIPVCAVPLRE
jgi:Tfp pilus assembly protein PilE